MKQLEAYYGLPNEVKFCTKCVISNQRPNSTVEMKNKNKNKETIAFDENELFNNVYLSCTQIKELKDHGNIIGSHTVNHKVLSRLSYKEQYSEIKNSFDFIDDLVEQEYKSFCYPYGYKSSYNQNTLNILKDLKIDDACIFDNNHQDDIIKQYELSRIDCNQFMGV